MIWFTADQHFDHDNVRGFCNRPFATVDEMNDELVAAWNKVVKPADTVWHLGDFTLGGPRKAGMLFRRLSGLIHIVSPTWHHDRKWINDSGQYFSNGGESQVVILGAMALVTIDAPRSNVITLCHYPMSRWEKSHFGSYHLFGHCHNSFSPPNLSFDVGVDSAYNLLGAYRPFSIDDAMAIIRMKEEKYARQTLDK